MDVRKAALACLAFQMASLTGLATIAALRGPARTELFLAHEGSQTVRLLQWAADGSLLLSAGAGSSKGPLEEVKVWDAGRNSQALPECSGPLEISLDPRGRYVAVLRTGFRIRDPYARLVPIREGLPEVDLAERLSVAKARIRCCSWSPDGSRLAVAKWPEKLDGELVTILETERFAPVRELAIDRVDFRKCRLVWHPDGTRLVTLTVRDPERPETEIGLWSVAGDRATENAVLPFVAPYQSWSPDGRRLALWGGVSGFEPDSPPRADTFFNLPAREPVRILDTGTWQVSVTLEARPFGQDILAWNADGSRFAHLYLRACEIYDARTGGKIATVRGREWFDSFAWHPDGKHLAAGNIEGEVEIWDVSQAGTLVGSLAASAPFRYGVLGMSVAPLLALLLTSVLEGASGRRPMSLGALGSAGAFGVGWAQFMGRFLSSDHRFLFLAVLAGLGVFLWFLVSKGWFARKPLGSPGKAESA